MAIVIRKTNKTTIIPRTTLLIFDFIGLIQSLIIRGDIMDKKMVMAPIEAIIFISFWEPIITKPRTKIPREIKVIFFQFIWKL